MAASRALEKPRVAKKPKQWEINNVTHAFRSNPEEIKSMYITRSSYNECVVDSLAIGAEEGRGKLRKAGGRCKQPMNPRCPNAETRRW